jgi:hypothetical protein
MVKTPSKKIADVASTIPFDKFWTWLSGHANCLLRVGTPEVIILDQDDCHWMLRSEDGQHCVVQLCRAKDLIAELLLFSGEVAFVQSESGDSEGEFMFECVVESEHARQVAYHFVLSHEYDGAEHPREDKWTH